MLNNSLAKVRARESFDYKIVKDSPDKAIEWLRDIDFTINAVLRLGDRSERLGYDAFCTGTYYTHLSTIACRKCVSELIEGPGLCKR